MMNNVQFSGWLIVLLFVSACSSRQAREVDESFITEIRGDGSKMFAFTLKAGNPPKEDKVREKKAGAKQGKKRPGKNSDRGAAKAGQGRENPLASVFQQKLAQRLAQSEYCRAGYIELDRYSSRGSMSVRGECNDSATKKDRDRFPNKLMPEDLY